MATTKTDYPNIPEGGLREAPADFDSAVHRKLYERDFVDRLTYLRHERAVTVAALSDAEEEVKVHRQTLEGLDAQLGILEAMNGLAPEKVAKVAEVAKLAAEIGIDMEDEIKAKVAALVATKGGAA